MKPVLRAARRRLRRLRRPPARAIVLLYHSISEAAFDPWDLCVRPEDFAAHLDILSRRAHVLSLSDLLTHLERGALPKRAVAITFDDGYVDNLHIARPLLQRHGMPATVFVTAGLIGSDRSFWWDELVQLTLAPVALPRVVRLVIAGRPFSFTLGADAKRDATSEVYRSWRFDGAPPTRRHALCRALWQRLQPLKDAERGQILADLRAQAQLDADASTLRIMSEAELQQLAAGGLIEIGAHTLTHPVLARLSTAEQRAEIAGGKAELERILGTPVCSFSYPHGGRADFTPSTVQAVRDAGFQCACTTTEDWVRPSANRYRLPRVHVPPASAAVFEELLDFWL